MSEYCNKCGLELSIFEMNDNEKEEFERDDEFTCSDCINNEMEKDRVDSE